MYKVDCVEYTRQLLERMQLRSHVATEPDVMIPPDMDLGLRAMLFGLENYADYVEMSMSMAEERTIYRFYNEYGHRYLFLKLPGEAAGYFLVGPFLTESPDEAAILRRAALSGLSGETARQLIRHYNMLPIVENENLLLGIIFTLADQLFGKNQYSLERIEYEIPDHGQPHTLRPAVVSASDSPWSLAMLEQNYRNEQTLMDAVAEGSLHKVSVLASAVFNNGTEQRVSDTLRNRRNYLIILNTLLRKAAEKGSVHPLHIDRMSSDFAGRIEAAASISDSVALQETMIRDYCQLVKKHSLRQFSPVIGRAVTLVAFDLTADLSLRSVAQQLNVRPTYLSTRFSKECGCTLTEYVNRRRIELGAALLQQKGKPVQEVAAECGVPDTNYFIKLFKRYMGVTPSVYRKEL